MPPNSSSPANFGEVKCLMMGEILNARPDLVGEPYEAGQQPDHAWHLFKTRI